VSATEIQRLDAVNVHGDGLRVQFYRLGPRWAHRVLAIERQATLALLESIEGDGLQSYPPSPALQQLVCQRREPTSPVALLLGMAGQNHWSVSVEAWAEQRVLRFDIACRYHASAAATLGSTYLAHDTWRRASNGQLETTSPAGVRYRLRPTQVEFTPLPEALVQPANMLQLRVVIDPDRRTQRWCYELQQI
jgi:hypothetical protein